MARSSRSRTSVSSSISPCRWRSSALPPTGGGVKKFFSTGKLNERFTECDKLARRGQTESDAAREALEVLDASQLFSNFAANHSLL